MAKRNYSGDPFQLPARHQCLGHPHGEDPYRSNGGPNLEQGLQHNHIHQRNRNLHSHKHGSGEANEKILPAIS